MKNVVETDLFEHQEVKPHFINPCCFGEDLALWLKQKILDSSEISFVLSDPIQEDYGWVMRVLHGDSRFWVALSYVGEGPQATPAQWVISIKQDSGFNLKRLLLRKPDLQHIQESLRDCILRILASSEAITIISS